MVGGYRGAYPRGFEGILSLVPEAEGAEHVIILLTSLVVLAVGAVAALRFYATDGSDALQVKKPELFAFLTNLRTSFDTAYGYYVEKVQQRAAILINFFDVIVLAGGIVRGLVARDGRDRGLRRAGPPHGPPEHLRLLVPGRRRGPLGLCRRHPLIIPR